MGKGKRTMKVKGFYTTGKNGSVTQIEDADGEIYTYDSVDGDGDETKVSELEAKYGDNIDWQRQPLASDFTAEEMNEYVGAA